ncbi:MAG TPA: hypothetical protein VMU11_00950 [Verrucomicrobiae bacterium]|nr:hypothetical protein [Verrucomicrobiae bacterium]
MLTVDSLKKSGYETADLSFFPKWKRDDPRQTPAEHACEMIMRPLPFCHYGFGVKDGLTLRAWDLFGLERLMRIRQLAFVKHPFVMHLDGTVEEGLCFDHSRGMHVLDVMSVITLIAENNRRQLERLHPAAFNLLRLAALTHDTLTPAGGDTVKMIDPDAFDEDARYHQLFSDMLGRERRHALCRELGFHWMDVDKAVQGKGLFGTLLDMADKTGYVTRDAGQFLQYCRGTEAGRAYFEEYPQIQRLVKADPWIGAWWESVRVDGETAWVDDGERLGRFLELRLRLFRGLYYHDLRTRDFVLPIVVTDYLYRTGRLKRAELLEMSDEQLEVRLAEFCGVPLHGMHKIAPVEMATERFVHMTEARHRERQLLIQGTPFVFVENIAAPLKPAMKFLVRGKNGPDQFHRVYREEAKRLHELCDIRKPIRLCYFKEDRIPKEHRKALLAYRREQAGLGRV